MNSYFVIVSKDDTPVYEADFFKPDLALKVKQFWNFNNSNLFLQADQQRNFRQFILHSALDMVEEQVKVVNT